MPMSRYWILIFIWLAAIRGLVFSQNDSLYVLSNLNGAIVDCHCSDTLNGGLSRFLTLKEKHPGSIFILNGDFLTSYPYPEFNQFILRLIQKVDFDLIVTGEQEFIHPVYKNAIEQDTVFGKSVLLPMTPAHLFYKVIRSRHRSYMVFLIFDVQGMENRAKELLSGFADTFGVQRSDSLKYILFFHGDWDKSRLFFERFQWLDGIIVGHEQEAKFYVNHENRFILSAGTDGEKAGQIIFKNDPTASVTVNIINLLNYEEHPYILEQYKEFKLNVEKRKIR